MIFISVNFKTPYLKLSSFISYICTFSFSLFSEELIFPTYWAFWQLCSSSWFCRHQLWQHESSRWGVVHIIQNLPTYFLMNIYFMLIRKKILKCRDYFSKNICPIKCLLSYFMSVIKIGHIWKYILCNYLSTSYYKSYASLNWPWTLHFLNYCVVALFSIIWPYISSKLFTSQMSIVICLLYH